MKHARSDYMRIQDPENKIPEDEPVFLIRGQDKLSIEVVAIYAELYMANGGDTHVYNKLMEHVKLMVEWQKDKKSQFPTIPVDVMG